MPVSKDKLNQRSNKFSLVLNDNELNLFKSSDHIVHKLLIEGLDICYIACIMHDNDCDDFGNLKTKHYHLIIVFVGNYRIGTIINLLVGMFHCNNNQISIEKCNNIASQVQYLIHLNDIDKYQYNKFDIVTNDKELTENYLKQLTNIKDSQELIRLCRVYKNPLDLLNVIGIDNYKKYRIVIQDIYKFI